MTKMLTIAAEVVFVVANGVVFLGTHTARMTSEIAINLPSTCNGEREIMFYRNSLDGKAADIVISM